jgi:hypothetical protein
MLEKQDIDILKNGNVNKVNISSYIKYYFDQGEIDLLDEYIPRFLPTMNASDKLYYYCCKGDNEEIKKIEKPDDAESFNDIVDFQNLMVLIDSDNLEGC